MMRPAVTELPRRVKDVIADPFIDRHDGPQRQAAPTPAVPLTGSSAVQPRQ